MKTFLNSKQIERLASVFADEEQYTENLEAMWALREVLSKKLGYPDIDKTNPLYKVWVLSNEIIGAIDDGRISIVNGSIRIKK